MRPKVTRRFSFSSGHRLYNPDYDDAKNIEIFGDCANPNGHGHNYKLYVTLSGPVDPNTGMAINLKDIKAIVNDLIIDKVDHKNLNLDVDFMRGLIPTTENFAMKIWEILEKAFETATLEKIILCETENNMVEISR